MISCGWKASTAANIIGIIRYNKISSGREMSVNLTKPANVSSIQLTWASTVGFTVSVLARSHGEHPTWSTVLHNVPATDVLQVQATSVTALSIHVHHESNLAASIQLDAINGKESIGAAYRLRGPWNH